MCPSVPTFSERSRQISRPYKGQFQLLNEHIVNHTTVCDVVCDGDSEGEEALGLSLPMAFPLGDSDELWDSDGEADCVELSDGI